MNETIPRRRRPQDLHLFWASGILFLIPWKLGPIVGQSVIGGSLGRYVGGAFGLMMAASGMSFIGPRQDVPKHRSSPVSMMAVGFILGPLIGLIGNTESWSFQDHVGWVLAAAVAGAIGAIIYEPLERHRDRLWENALLEERRSLEARREEGRYDLMLIDTGIYRMRVVHYVRKYTRLSRRDARRLIDELSQPLLQRVSWEDAMKAWMELKREGAYVEI